MEYTKKLTCNKCRGYKKLENYQYCLFRFKTKIEEKNLNGKIVKCLIPIQRCPKPLTWDEYVFLLDERLKRRSINRLDKVQKVLNLIFQYGGTNEEHHLRWVIDQTVRILLNDENKYNEWVKKYKDGDDGENTYEWDIGIAP